MQPRVCVGCVWAVGVRLVVSHLVNQLVVGKHSLFVVVPIQVNGELTFWLTLQPQTVALRGPD